MCGRIKESYLTPKMHSQRSLGLGGESECAWHFQTRHWGSFQLHFNAAQLKGNTSESAVLYFPRPVFPGKAMTSPNHRVHHSYIQMKKGTWKGSESSMETVIYPHSFPLKKSKHCNSSRGFNSPFIFVSITSKHKKTIFEHYIHTEVTNTWLTGAEFANRKWGKMGLAAQILLVFCKSNKYALQFHKQVI